MKKISQLLALLLVAAVTASAALDDFAPTPDQGITLGADGPTNRLATHYVWFVREVSETSWTHHALIPAEPGFTVWCSYFPRPDVTNVFMVRATNIFTGEQSRQSMSLTNVSPKLTNSVQYKLPTPGKVFKVE